MGPSPLVGIVTVTYNSEEVLPEFLRCIESLRGVAFRLFVVDNASRDRTASLLAECQFPELRTLRNPENIGVAAGNNQGIEAALKDGCEYVLLLNNDVAFGAGLLELLLAGAAAYSAHLIVPKIYYYDDPCRIWAVGARFQAWKANAIRHRGAGRIDRGQFDRPAFVANSPTCCMMIHRSAIERIGRMDENYFVYFDDSDFCLRASRAGLKILVWPQAVLWHKVSSLTGAASPFALRILIRNRVYFIRKHQPRLLVPFWLAIFRTHLYLKRLRRVHSDVISAADERRAFNEGLELGAPESDSSVARGE